MNSHTWFKAVPPTISAGPRLRAGFTDVPVIGMPTRCATVSDGPMTTPAPPSLILKSSQRIRLRRLEIMEVVPVGRRRRHDHESRGASGSADAGGAVARREQLALGVVGGQAGDGVRAGIVAGAEPENDDRAINAPPGVTGLNALAVHHPGDLYCRARVIAELRHRVTVGARRRLHRVKARCGIRPTELVT